MIRPSRCDSAGIVCSRSYGAPVAEVPGAHDLPATRAKAELPLGCSVYTIQERCCFARRKRKQRSPYLNQRKKRHSAHQCSRKSESGFRPSLLADVAVASRCGCKS